MPNDQLPPLPDPERWVKFDGGWADKPKASDQAAFSIVQMRAYAEEAVRLEREACLNIAISWTDKSFEAEQIEVEIRARNV